MVTTKLLPVPGGVMKKLVLNTFLAATCSVGWSLFTAWPQWPPKPSSLLYWMHGALSLTLLALRCCAPHAW